MGSFSEDDFGFFDAREDIASVSDASGENIEVLDASSCAVSWVRDSFPYDVWVRSPGSVKERRVRFLDWMEVSAGQIVRENLVEVCSDVSGEICRVRESSGAVLRSLSFEGEFSSSRSSISFWANEFRDGNLSGRMECKGDEVGQNVEVSEGREVTEESERTSFSLSSLSRQLSERRAEEIISKGAILKTVKKKWLSRLRSMTCLDDRPGIADRSPETDEDTIMGIRSHRMKVRHSRKRLKELSALYMGQDIQAHEGSIFAMKFSPDGQYLASAGEDGVVRVWQVVENQRCNELDIPEIDPSCIYFTVNHLSELNPLFADKEKVSKARSMRKTPDSACVIFPPKIFRIVDKLLHEFHGHGGEILALSWSTNNVSSFLSCS